jgi:type I restriction enzyme, S subunit
MNKINLGNDLYLKGRIGWRGLSKEEYLDKSDYRIINATALEDGFVNWSRCGYIGKERYGESPEIMLQEKDLLISKDGTIGKVGYVRNLTLPSTVASGIFVLRNIKSSLLDTDYLYHYLKSKFFKFFISKVKADGSTIKHLYQRDLSQLTLDLPSIKIQKKIAHILNILEYKLELNNKIIAELESISKTIFDYWFVQFNFPDKNGRAYKSNGGAMVWNKIVKREIPKGWKVSNLLEVAEFINGLPCQKYRPTGNDFLRVIKIKEMHKGFSSETEFVTPQIPKKGVITNGDILFSWSASLEVQIWSGGRGALNQHIFKVVSEKYPKSFYYHQLLNYLQHFKMMAKNRKTTMGHITHEHLEQSKIILPPEKLNNLLVKCEEIISPLIDKKISCEIENQQLSKLKDFLLPMLMNGQVKVN